MTALPTFLLPWVAAGAALLLLALVATLLASGHNARRARALETELGALRTTLELMDQRALQLAGRHAEEAARLQAALAEQRVRSEEQHGRGLATLQGSLRESFDSLHRQLGEALLRGSTDLGHRVEALTRITDERLKGIAGEVDRRLADGFDKTTATFADVQKRLALIDEAQKKITALSAEVVSLQEILVDKRSRGAFGEVQLAQLVANVLPPASYALQHRLGNDRIADCALFLPPPTGTICVDSKFPLESYRILADPARDEAERKRAEAQFKQDIRKHVRDIAEKYILRDVTADSAIMFVPAEAVFAEIQGRHPDLVELAHGLRVWLASPTTLWAILNTAAAVLKDAATREQVDIIQRHLGHLGDDFQRFRQRMDRLASHIQQASRDVDEVNVSARKITERFEKIERVELEPAEVSKGSIRQAGEGQAATREPGLPPTPDQGRQA
ncbi:MAG: DNA recombination protein RmuC [Gammaproteobacteria bacterium]